MCLGVGGQGSGIRKQTTAPPRTLERVRGASLEELAGMGALAPDPRPLTQGCGKVV